MECRTSSYCWLVSKVSFIIFSVNPCLVWAGSPRVSFDVGSSIACRDVTTPEFSKSHSHERLVEAKFSISSLVQGAQPNDLFEFMIRLESPEHTAEVVDYSPKTTLAGNYAGSLSYEKKQESSSSLGAGVSAEINNIVKIGGSGDNGLKDGSTVKYELLPPLEQLSASGTIGRGHGVYFKLQPSRRTSLEGAKEFQVVLRVPAGWRGDYVFLKCEAIGQKLGPKKTMEPVRYGGRTFILPLYLEGDEESRSAASGFIAAEASLRYAATAIRSVPPKRVKQDVWHQLGLASHTPEPKPALDWLDRLVFGSVHSTGKLDPAIPAGVRSTATEFAAAKQQMWELSQGVAVVKISG